MRSASPQSASALPASAARSAFPASVAEQRSPAARRSACGMRSASPQSAVRAFRVRSVFCSLPRWPNSEFSRAAFRIRYAPSFAVINRSRLCASTMLSVFHYLGDQTAQSSLAAFRMRYAPSFAAVGVRAFRVRSASRSLPRWSNSVVRPRSVPHAVCAQLRRSRCPRLRVRSVFRFPPRCWSSGSHPCFFARVLFFLTAIRTGGSPA